MAWAALLCELAATRTLAAADVRWLAPPGCTDPRATLEETERLLGRPLAAFGALDFDVRITAVDGKWQLKLGTVDRATGERRERVLEGNSCGEVTSAAAVAMAMVVDSRQASTPEPEPEPELTPGEPARPDGEAAPSRARAKPEAKEEATPGVPSPSRPLRWSLELAGLADLGAFPEFGVGAMAAGVAGYGRLRLMALGGVLLSSYEQAAGQSADFALVTGGLLACAQQTVGPALAWLCGGAEMGRLSGTGVGVRNPRSGGSWWWGPRTDVGAAFPLGDELRLLGQVTVIAPQIRPAFVLDQAFVYRPAAVTGRLALGIELGLE
jgi:hypothetical protein